MKTDLRSAVEARLTELNKSAFRAAREAGLDRHFLDDILNGKKRSIKPESYAKVAKALEWTIPDIRSIAEGNSEMSRTAQAEEDQSREDSLLLSLMAQAFALPAFPPREARVLAEAILRYSRMPPDQLAAVASIDPAAALNQILVGLLAQQQPR